jgi:hypothetical protein
MVGQALMGIKTADGKQNFTFCNSSKGKSATLLQAAGRYSTTACNTLVFSRIFWILHAVSNPFLQAATGNLIPFRA